MKKKLLILAVALLLPAASGAGADSGTLRDRHGAIMRGTPLVLGRGQPAAVAFAEAPATWARLKTGGFNTVRLCWVDPWYRDRNYDSWTAAEVLPHIDTCVQRAAEAGMNVIINYHNVGEQQNGVDFSLLADFWQVVAPRHRNEDHVFYEISNEPTFNGTDYLEPAFRAGLREVYDQVRADAPGREILMFSFNSLGHDMAGIVAAYEEALDWNHTSVAFHMYSGDGTSAKIRDLMTRYRVICTEWDYPGRFDYVPVVDGDEPNCQTLERLGCSWTDWRDWGDVTLNELFDVVVPDARANGYWWGQ